MLHNLVRLLLSIKLCTRRLLKLQIIDLRPFFIYFTIVYLYLSTIYILRTIFEWNSLVGEDSVLNLIATMFQQISYDIIATGYLSCKHGINLTRTE